MWTDFIKEFLQWQKEGRIPVGTRPPSSLVSREAREELARRSGLFRLRSSVAGSKCNAPSVKRAFKVVANGFCLCSFGPAVTSDAEGDEQFLVVVCRGTVFDIEEYPFRRCLGADTGPPLSVPGFRATSGDMVQVPDLTEPRQTFLVRHARDFCPSDVWCGLRSMTKRAPHFDRMTYAHCFPPKKCTNAKGIGQRRYYNKIRYMSSFV